MTDPSQIEHIKNITPSKRKGGEVSQDGMAYAVAMHKKAK
jgi:hypothetical protein